MESREKLVFLAVSIIGVLSVAIATAHATYLGFNFTYAYLGIIGGTALLGLGYGLSRTGKLSGILTSTTRTLLAITGVGVLLRVIMMLNPDASLDELNFLIIVARSKPLSLVSFVQNFNQIAGYFSLETSPFTFFLMKIGYIISPTLLGVRLVPVVLNILLVPISYWLAMELSTEKVARLTAFLFAISPAALYFLDAADTDIFVFFFGMAGLLFLVRAVKRSSLKLAILSGLIFGLAYWSKAALPQLWIVTAIIFAATLLGRTGRPKKLLLVATVVVIAVGAFLPWSFVDPQSFNQSFTTTAMGVVNQFSNPSSIDLGGSGLVVSSATASTASPTATTTSPGGPPVTTTTSPGAQESPWSWSSLVGTLTLTNIIPRFQAGGGTYTSVVDVFAQVPFWFGPMAFILGIPFLFYSLLKNQKRGIYIAMLIWILLISFALFSVNRDVRYFVDVATFPVLFITAEAVESHRSQFARYLRVLVVLFAIVFLMLGAVAGYELYSGIAESSQFVNQNFQHATVLVNYGGFFFLLSQGDHVSFMANDPAVLNANISAAKADAVLVWNQARETSLPKVFFTVLDSHYQHQVEFGLSNFSYVTVYYGYVS